MGGWEIVKKMLDGDFKIGILVLYVDDLVQKYCMSPFCEI